MWAPKLKTKWHVDAHRSSSVERKLFMQVLTTGTVKSADTSGAGVRHYYGEPEGFVGAQAEKHWHVDARRSSSVERKLFMQVLTTGTVK